MSQPPNAGKSSLPPPPSEAESLDAPLHMIGFEFEELSAKRVAGRLPITSKCCQVLLLSLTHLR